MLTGSPRMLTKRRTCSSQAPAASTRSLMYCSTESTRCTICRGGQSAAPGQQQVCLACWASPMNRAIPESPCIHHPNHCSANAAPGPACLVLQGVARRAACRRLPPRLPAVVAHRLQALLGPPQLHNVGGTRSAGSGTSCSKRSRGSTRSAAGPLREPAQLWGTGIGAVCAVHMLSTQHKHSRLPLAPNPAPLCKRMQNERT